MNTQKRELNQDQKQRILDHKASISLKDDGTFIIKATEILTPNGVKKTNKQISVVPSEDERVLTITQASSLFDDLQHVNVILTNACNLSCSYCYEQHNKDYGRFTPESLKQVYDFLVNANDRDGKIFQFFGGEPLIHKQLILDFIEKYDDDIVSTMNNARVGMITNGILLTPEFIKQYFGKPFTSMSISLDTINADIDHREIGQEKIDHIVEMVGLIPEQAKNTQQVSIRCTISMETAPFLRDFTKTLYNKGIRAMVIHPLTMSSVDGFLVWPQDTWNQLHDDIVWALDNLPGFTIQFSEGVGVKGGSNCMVGADMIAVDGSGDYSGCYFFTNLKSAAEHTILGNILEDRVYVDRYAAFQGIYDEMFETEEQCKTCNLKNFCYQCPAGNLDTGTQLFRPDDMCQQIVRLFIDLQSDIVKKSFKMKLNELVNAVKQEGEHFIFAKALTHLMYKYVTGFHLPVGEVDTFRDKLPDYRLILGRFLELVRFNSHGGLPCACDYISSITPENTPMIDIKTFYEELMNHLGKSAEASKKTVDGIDDVNKRIFYLALIHLVVLNPKGDDLEKPKKNYMESFVTL